MDAALKQILENFVRDANIARVDIRRYHINNDFSASKEIQDFLLELGRLMENTNNFIKQPTPKTTVLEGPKCVGCGEELKSNASVYKYRSSDFNFLGWTHANQECWDKANERN